MTASKFPELLTEKPTSCRQFPPPWQRPDGTGSVADPYETGTSWKVTLSEPRRVSAVRMGAVPSTWAADGRHQLHGSEVWLHGSDGSQTLCRKVDFPNCRNEFHCSMCIACEQPVLSS